MLNRARTSRLLFCWVFGITFVCSLSAQKKQTTYKDTAGRDLPNSILDSTKLLKAVTVTARSLNKEIVTPQSLTGKELKAMSNLSVADAIRFFSGMHLKDYGGIGGLGALDVRNMGTNQMNIFYDGIQLKTQNGQIDLGKFSLDNVEAISLHNGQKSGIFQSAKDFGYSGAIYLTSRRPKFEGQKQGNIKATLKTGSFGLFNPAVLGEYKISENIGASFSGEWINANGKYTFNYRRKAQLGDVVYDTTAVRQNGDINATRIEGGLYGIIDRGKWTIRAQNFNTERGVPGSIVNGEFREGERWTERSSFIQGTINKEFSNQFQSMMNIKYSSDYTYYQDHDTFHPQEEKSKKNDKAYKNDSRYRQKELYISSANLYSLTDNWNISLSTDFQWNQLNATYIMPEKQATFPTPSRYTTMIAGATSYEVWKLKAQASGLLTIASYDVKRNAKPKDKSVFTPAFFLSFKPLDKHDIIFNGFIKQMFKMPSLNDMYYTDMDIFVPPSMQDSRSNAHLKPEHVTQYNLGIKYSKELKLSFWKYFELEVNAYHHDVVDKLIAFPKSNQFVWTRTNLGKVKVQGITVSMAHLFELKSNMYINLKAVYTYEKAENLSAEAKKGGYYRHQIPYIPWHTASAMASFKYNEWSVFYSFLYTGERYNQPENYYNTHVQPWYTSDIAIMKEITLKTTRLKLTAEINNLFGQNYEVILNYPMPKTSYRFSVSIEL